MMTIEEQTQSPQQQTTVEQTTQSDTEVTSLVTAWTPITLPSVLSLSQLSEFKEELDKYRGQRVQLKGHQVKRIDTASLQLLLAFMRSPEVTAGWVEPSIELCSAARLLGLSTALGLPTLETSLPEQVS
ncbi:MAG: STAS domain-containing protein [Pseudomonadota bacterium]|nr:STAS domain-containing protein [Pseudomonadota bacterium]